MANDDLDEIKRLRPEDRIERLRELEKKKKQDIEDAERMIRESITEIKEQRIREEIEVPRAGEVDITRLFKQEEQGIESIAKAAEEELKETEQKIEQYATRLEKLRGEMYDGRVSERQRAEEEANRIYSRLGDIRENYQLTERAENLLNVSRSIAYEIRKYSTK